MGRETATRKRIVEALSRNSEGLTILDLAESVGAHRHTVTKYVQQLLEENILRMREIGPAKLCILNRQLDDGTPQPEEEEAQ